MGNSTNAYLFWGLCVDGIGSWWTGGAGGGDPDGGDGAFAPAHGTVRAPSGWEDALAYRSGLREPTEPYEGHEGEWLSYWEARRRLVADSGCGVGWHCSGDRPMPFVAVAESLVCAARGRPAEVAPVVGPEWGAKLRRFCDILGVEWAEPKWWLASYASHG